MRKLNCILWLSIFDKSSSFYLLGKCATSPRCKCGYKMTFVGLFSDFNTRLLNNTIDDDLSIKINDMPSKLLSSETLFQFWYCFECENRGGSDGFLVQKNSLSPAKAISKSLYYDREVMPMLDLESSSFISKSNKELSRLIFLEEQKKLAKRSDVLFPGQGFYHYGIAPFKNPSCPSCDLPSDLWFAMDSFVHDSLIWGDCQTLYVFNCKNDNPHHFLVVS